MRSDAPTCQASWSVNDDSTLLPDCHGRVQAVLHRHRPRTARLRALQPRLPLFRRSLYASRSLTSASAQATQATQATEATQATQATQASQGLPNPQQAHQIAAENRRLVRIAQE